MALPKWINDYIGIPYKSGGRSREGLDCWGLVQMVKNEVFDEIVPAYTGYESADDRNEIKAIIQNKANQDRWKEIPYSEAKEGDIIIMSILGDRCHAGIYVTKDFILHIRRGTESCIEQINERYSEIRIKGAYRCVKAN